MRIEKLTRADWVALESAASFTSVFHDIRWLELVRDCFGGVLDLYLCTGLRYRWLVPCYSEALWSQNGFRIGGVGYGGPIPLGAEDIDPLGAIECLDAVAALEAYLGRGCTGGSSFPSNCWNEVSSRYLEKGRVDCTALMALRGSPEEMFKNLISGNKRTTLRRAGKTGLEVRTLTVTDAVQAHNLICATQARVEATYRTPLSFIERVVFGEAIDAELHGAFHAGELLSITLTLFRKGKAFLLFHGWDRERAMNTGANELCYWTAISSAAQRGIGIFDLGRSHSQTLLASKLRWGASTTPVYAFDHSQ